MRGFFWTGFLLISFILSAAAQERDPADLLGDLQVQNEFFDHLIQNMTSEEEIQQIIAHPENYIPPVLFALSGYFSERNQKDQALHYFLLARCRAQMDLAENDLFREYREKILDQYMFFFGHSYQRTFSDYPELAEKIHQKAKQEAEVISRNYSSYWLYFDGAETLQNLTDLKSELTSNRQ